MEKVRRTLVGVLTATALACGGTESKSGMTGTAGSTASADGATGRVDGAAGAAGGPVCSSATPSGCGGICTDLAIDPDNCGACGLACAPSAVCVRGNCGPGPTTVVPANPGCMGIHVTVAGGTVYWTDPGHGTVKSQPIGGGAATTIAPSEMRPDRIRVSETNLFWLSLPSTIRTARLPEGSPADLVNETSNGTIPGFVVSDDGQAIFYLVNESVKRVPVAGGPSVEVARGGTGTPTQLAIGGSALAYLDTDDLDVVTLMDGAVATCGMLDAISRFGTNNPGAVNCALQWFETQEYVFVEGLFFRGVAIHSNLHSSDGPSLALSPVVEMVGDSNDIFLISSDGASRDIGKMPYGSGFAPTILARRQAGATSLALDATNVYWSTGDCAVNSVAK
jgi:hypothetical protein